MFQRLFRRRARQPKDVEVAMPRRGFLQLGGRRYVADAPYLLPKDLKEIDRLDFQHFMLRYLIRGNFNAPLRQPLSILDVGSGTNRWGIEVALQFPQANVVGVDLIETPTTTIQAPENYLFVQGNVLNLPFDAGNFDFVHQRLLVLALPEKDWFQAIQEVVRVTRPGGWVELVESTGQVEFLHLSQGEEGIANLRKLNAWSDQACAKRGIRLTVGGQIGQVLNNARLGHVQQRQIPIPLGAHGGRIGTMMEANYMAALGGLRNLILAMQVTSANEYDAAVAAAPTEIARNTCTFPYYIAYGQKH